MCDLCWRSRCPSSCPNAEPPKQVFVCSGCGQPIYEGSEYYDILGEQFCETCIDEARKEAEYDPN